MLREFNFFAITDCIKMIKVKGKLKCTLVGLTVKKLQILCVRSIKLKIFKNRIKMSLILKIKIVISVKN